MLTSLMRRRGAVASALLCVLLVGCSGTSPAGVADPSMAPTADTSTAEIKIGVIAPITGETAFLGEQMKALTDYVQAEIDAAGGINGAKVSISVEDDAGNSSGAATVTQKLTSVDKVNGIIGPMFSSSVLAAKPIVEAAEVPIVEGTAAHDDIFSENGWVFSIDATNEASISAYVKYLNGEKGFTKISFLGNYNDETLDMMGILREMWAATGSQLLTEATFNAGTNDFRTELTKIKEAAPEALIIAADAEEMKNIIRQMSELGMNELFIMTDYQAIQAADFFQTFGEILDGRLVFAQTGVASDAATQAVYETFVEGYKAATGEAPEAHIVLFYDCFHIMFNAMKTAPSGAALRQAIADTTDFVGASGNITFDSAGRSTGAATLWEYVGGASQPLPADTFS